MFVTHEPFKFPIQFGGEGTTWQAVELMLETPWLILSVEDKQDELRRNIFVDGTDTLLQLLTNS